MSSAHRLDLEDHALVHEVDRFASGDETLISQVHRFDPGDETFVPPSDRFDSGDEGLVSQVGRFDRRDEALVSEVHRFDSGDQSLFVMSMTYANLRPAAASGARWGTSSAGALGMTTGAPWWAWVAETQSLTSANSRASSSSSAFCTKRFTL